MAVARITTPKPLGISKTVRDFGNLTREPDGVRGRPRNVLPASIPRPLAEARVRWKTIRRAPRRLMDRWVKGPFGPVLYSTRPQGSSKPSAVVHWRPAKIAFNRQRPPHRPNDSQRQPSCSQPAPNRISDRARGLIIDSPHLRFSETAVMHQNRWSDNCSLYGSIQPNFWRHLTTSQSRPRRSPVSYGHPRQHSLGVSHLGKSHPTSQRRSEARAAIISHARSGGIPARTAEHFPDLGPWL